MTDTFDSTRLANFLREFVKAGYFDNCIEQYLNFNYRNNSASKPYSTILEFDGRKAADDWLEKYALDRYDERVADSLKPLAEAFVHLLEANYHQMVKVERFEKSGVYPFPYRSSDAAVGFLISNPRIPRKYFASPERPDLFSPEGVLGIQSFVVIMDAGRPSQNAIGLVLPLNGDSRNILAATLCRNGEVDLDGREVILHDDAFVRLMRGEDPYWWSKTSPGAKSTPRKDFIISNLGGLTAYVNDVADYMARLR